jgi:spore coat protein A, manganese oxidase
MTQSFSTRLGLPFAVLSLLAMSACASDAGTDDGAVAHVYQAVSFTLQLPLPPVLSPTSTDATTDYYNVEMKSGTKQIRSSGAATPIWGYNGMYPGPTIVATRGRNVNVTHKNSLTENMTVHNHGHKVAASSDGHPTDYITPGSSKVYTYPNDQRGGTYWYHDHTMDLTGPHVYKGLAAFYIIRDPAEDALNLPSGAYDVPLVVQDKSFGSNNVLSYSSDASREGFLGSVAVVNGAETPNFNVANRKYRFRVLNGANARDWNFSLEKSGSSSYSSSKESFQLIASDGGLLTAPLTVTSLRSAPAERHDIVVDFSLYPVGTKLTLKNAGDGWPNLSDVMQFTVNRAETDTSAVPAQLSSITRYARTQSVGTFDVSLDEGSRGGADWVINGLAYDPARIDVRNNLNNVYIWRIRNNTRDMHPFHKHLVQFNILSINGAAPPPEKNGWKDTIAVDGGDTVEIIFKNETFAGTYVFHCHRLEHEDHRMMAQEQTQ